jgi:hypothetical protein
MVHYNSHVQRRQQFSIDFERPHVIDGRRLDHCSLNCMFGWRRALVEGVASRYRSLLLARPALVPALIGVILAAFPVARTIIWVSNRHERRRLASQLSRLMWPRSVRIYRSTADWPRAGETAITTDKLIPSPFDDGVDLIIFPDAYRFSCMQYADHLEDDFQHRVIGFLPINHPRNLRQLGVVRGLLGWPLFEFDTAAGPRAHVSVELLESTSSVNGSCDPLHMKRKTIWHNWQRNALIADAARRATDGNDDAWLFGVPPCHLRTVALLVDGREHGKELESLLPDWQYVDGPLSAYTGSSGFKPLCQNKIFSLVRAENEGDVCRRSYRTSPLLPDRLRGRQQSPANVGKS